MSKLLLIACLVAIAFGHIVPSLEKPKMVAEDSDYLTQVPAPDVENVTTKDNYNRTLKVPTTGHNNALLYTFYNILIIVFILAVYLWLICSDSGLYMSTSILLSVIWLIALIIFVLNNHFSLKFY